MDVVCNVQDCAYHGKSGFCTKDFMFIVGGTCRWLINNPNYRTPAYVEPIKEEKPKEPDKITDNQFNNQEQ